MFKMLSKAVFSTFSDSWTSEIAVSFIKSCTHVTLFILQTGGGQWIIVLETLLWGINV